MYRKTDSPKLDNKLSCEFNDNKDTKNLFVPNMEPDAVVIELKDQLQLEECSRVNCGFDMKSEANESITPISNGKLKVSEESDFDSRKCQKLSLQDRVTQWIKENLKVLHTTFRVILFSLYNIYLGFAIYLTWSTTYSWCEGVRFLLLVTGAIYGCVFYKYILRPYLSGSQVLQSTCNLLNQMSNIKHGGKMIWTLIWFSIVVFLIVDSEDNRYRLVSATGLLTLLFLGFIFSAHRSKVIWHQVQLGVLMQFLFGLLILRWDVGKAVFSCIGDKVKSFLEFADKGSSFVFGYLVTGELKDLPIQPAVFAFKVLCVIIYFSFIISVLYYYGCMQWLVLNLGWFLQKTIGTTACESINAAGNIFLGMSEAPLIIKPYLPHMTKSELHAVMTGGFATIAGSVLAAYISFGVNASHLLSASVMSAPAALAFSKLVYPETEISLTSAENIEMQKPSEKSALEAGANGASTAIKLVSNVAANLIAFVAVISLADFLLSWFGSLVNWDVSFEWLLSKLFVPLSIMMGVDWKDKEEVARLVGLKTTINEFVAYMKLSELQKTSILSPRSEAIATFALCGFSNIGSIGIQIGCLGSMAPERKPDLARLALRAMIAGSAACFMTACVAGALLKDLS